MVAEQLFEVQAKSEVPPPIPTGTIKEHPFPCFSASPELVSPE